MRIALMEPVAEQRMAASQRPYRSYPHPPVSEILEHLKEGNRRFVERRPTHEHTSREWRDHLVSGQKPFAVVIGCSDSRVPPELIFDQGFGDLFVIRNAGNVIATDVLGSTEYAIAQFRIRLVIVMGHEGCGAVTAALLARRQRQGEPEELQAILQMIDAAFSDLAPQEDEEQRISAAVEANVRWAVKQLVQLLPDRLGGAATFVKVVGAVYELESGQVRFLR
jgi:carbonic anhydrase